MRPLTRPDLTKRGYKVIDGLQRTGIKCLDCGLVSFHPEDISKRYCGNCHKFHPRKKGIDV